MQRTFARRSAIPSPDNHQAKGSLSIFPELVLGSRSMGFSPCRPPRSPPPHRRAVSESGRVSFQRTITELVLSGPPPGQ